ncbi:hypothetical protein DFH09DRAFT_1333999 [Mycena vulgaris]|nr:hypothetical protein DFH09DRAFT_1333999 [Mycena vulgaris]
MELHKSPLTQSYSPPHLPAPARALRPALMETDDRVVCACPAVIFHLASAPFPPAPHDTVTPLHRTGPSPFGEENTRDRLSITSLAPLSVLVCPYPAHAVPRRMPHARRHLRTTLCAPHPPKSSPPAPSYRRIPYPPARPPSLVPAYTHLRPPPPTTLPLERERPGAPARPRAGGSEHGAPAVAMGSPSPRRCTPHPSSLHLLHPRRLAAAPAAPPSRSISICLILAQFEFACLAFSLGLRADLDRFGIH